MWEDPNRKIPYVGRLSHKDSLCGDVPTKGNPSVGSPGEDEKGWDAEENGQEIGEKEPIMFEGAAAKLTGTGPLEYDICHEGDIRRWAKPTKGGCKKVKRLARYLVGKPRMVMKYRWEREE